MRSIETMRMPVLGEVGEPCAGCGAPLAADQRYCLNCGQRRGGSRVDYRRYLAPAGDEVSPPPLPEAPTATAAQQEPAKPERDHAPLAAVGGIAVLGLMLLVGVLIGKGNGTTATTPAPVIEVPAMAGTTSVEPGAQEASSGSKGSKGSKGVDTGAKAVSGGLTGDAARGAQGTVQASEGDLEALNNTSGEGYQDAVKKLPDKIATPGAPPPIDKSKAPGAGGEAETFE